MPYDKGILTPVEATGIARGAFDAAYEGFAIASLLPTEENFTLDYQFEVGKAPGPAAAKFRAYNTPSMQGTDGTGETASGKLPATSIRRHVDEYQQLFMYRQAAAIKRKFEQYAERNATAIAYRVVLAAAEALETGKISVNERGLAFGVDFGRRADLTADAGVSWGSAAATPFTDLEALKRVFKRRVGSIRMSELSLAHLQRSEEVMKRALKRSTDLPDIISQEDVRAAFRDFGLGSIVLNEDVVNDTDGNEVPVFSENAVMLTGTGPLGSVQVGVTAESFNSDNGIPEEEAPGLFAGVLASEDPEGYDVRVTGILLPVLDTPNNTAVLKV